jgi:hypothetical protein
MKKFRGKEIMGVKVYIIQCNEFIKIGSSANVPTRICGLQSCSPYDIKLLKVIEHECPRWYENYLHNKYEPYKERGEWFKLPTTVLNELLNDSHTISPF